MSHAAQSLLFPVGKLSGKVILQWYRNILENPSIQVDARGEHAYFRAVPIQESQAVKSVIAEFRKKYGPDDVKRYYSRFDVAVLAEPF